MNPREQPRDRQHHNHHAAPGQVPARSNYQAANPRVAGPRPPAPRSPRGPRPGACAHHSLDKPYVQRLVNFPSMPPGQLLGRPQPEAQSPRSRCPDLGTLMVGQSTRGDRARRAATATAPRPSTLHGWGVTQGAHVSEARGSTLGALDPSLLGWLGAQVGARQ